MKNRWPYAQSQWMLVSIPPGGEPEPEPGLNDGDPVTTWEDSSGNGNDATQAGSVRPIFKTNIVNGLPVVRFTTAGASTLNLSTPISGASPWRVFVVMKRASAGSEIKSIRGATTLAGFQETGSGPYVAANDNTSYAVGALPSQAFHVYSAVSIPAFAPVVNVDGTNVSNGDGVSPTSENFIIIGGGDGDIAEILIYLASMTPGNRANIEKYLGTKYAITVAGGTAVDPTSVSGLTGWWKADSLLG